MKDFDIEFRLLKEHVARAIKEAYIDGYNAGSAADKPTQQEFDDAHQQPMSYGEDGEIYVLAGSYTEQEALNELQKLFDKEMFDYENPQELADQMNHTKIAYIPEDISSEPGYYYRNDGSGVYEAWVWTT
jgi:hypothetical protein